MQIVDLNTIHIFADAVMQPNEKIVLEIFSDSGKIASAEGTDVTITIPDAHLWSSEDPYLYTCQATLLQGGTVIDTAKKLFRNPYPFLGKRWIPCKQQSRPFPGCLHPS